MKKKLSLLIALSALTLSVGAAVGVGAGMKSVEEAKADVSSVPTKIYVNDDFGWSDLKYYLWNSADTSINNGAWPGQSFSDDMKTPTPNELDQYQYVINLSGTSFDRLIISGFPSGWGKRGQTNDIELNNLGGDNAIYKGDQVPSSSNFYINTYFYSTKTVYMLDLAGNVYKENHYCHTFASGKVGTTWPGVEMTKVLDTNNLYSVEINSKLDNVMFNNNSSKQTETIASVADGNVYVVYPDNGYNTFTSSDALDAAKFIDKYMKFETRWTDVEGTGECLSLNWYTNARDEFRDNLSAGVKAIVLTHEPTTARLAAWATAKGETFNPSSGAFNSIVATSLIAIESEQANYTAVIILASTLALAAVGGYFLLRKARKED